MRKPTTITLAAVILLSAFLAACESEESNGAANKKEAVRVVAAVKGYQAQNGRYPATLDELIPQFLAQQPQARGKVKWHYTVAKDGRNFRFAYVGYSTDWTGGYVSEGDYWYLDDK